MAVVVQSLTVNTNTIRQSEALSSTTQHAMSLKLAQKCTIEYLNTKFPLPIPWAIRLVAKKKYFNFNTNYCKFLIISHIWFYFIIWLLQARIKLITQITKNKTSQRQITKNCKKVWTKNKVGSRYSRPDT